MELLYSFIFRVVNITASYHYIFLLWTGLLFHIYILAFLNNYFHSFSFRVVSCISFISVFFSRFGSCWVILFTRIVIFVSAFNILTCNDSCFCFSSRLSYLYQLRGDGWASVWRASGGVCHATLSREHVRFGAMPCLHFQLQHRESYQLVIR